MRLVVAGRLILLLLAGAAVAWAFAFSGAGERAPIEARGHAHVHGASPAPVASQVFTLPHPADARVIGTAEARTFSLSVRAAAWLDGDGRVTAVLRNDELSGLSPGERAFFF